MSNIFTWWPKVSEKPNDSLENHSGFNSIGDNLEADWAWMYWELPDKQRISDAIYQEQNETNDNPEDIFDGLEQWNEESKIPENIKSIAEFSIVELLSKKWYINEKQVKELVDILAKTQKQDTKDVIFKFVYDIVENDEVKKDIKNNIEGKKDVNEENFENSQFYKSANSEGIDIDINLQAWGLETMLAQNYIEIPEANNTQKDNSDIQNKKDALNTSIEITLNKIIDKNSEIFRENNSELIAEIRAEKSLDIKYTKLKEIYKNDLIDDAKKWGSKAKKEIAQKRKNMEEKTNKLKESLKKDVLNEKITQEQADKKWKEFQTKLKIEWRENSDLEKEILAIEWVIDWWELDFWNEAIEKPKKD